MNRFIGVISGAAGTVKKIAAFCSCIAKAGHAFHEEWLVHFPEEKERVEVVKDAE